jgi:hypothetical protein
VGVAAGEGVEARFGEGVRGLGDERALWEGDLEGFEKDWVAEGKALLELEEEREGRVEGEGERLGLKVLAILREGVGGGEAEGGLVGAEETEEVEEVLRVAGREGVRMEEGLARLGVGGTGVAEVFLPPEAVGAGAEAEGERVEEGEGF